MLHENIELVQVFISWVATLPTVATIVVADERRLTGEARARAWPRSSRDAMIFGTWLVGAPYASLGLIAHFSRTRRGLRGALLGVGWAVALLAVDLLAELAVTWTVDTLGL